MSGDDYVTQVLASEVVKVGAGTGKPMLVHPTDEMQAALVEFKAAARAAHAAQLAAQEAAKRYAAAVKKLSELAVEEQ